VNRGLLVRYFMDHGDIGAADGALIDAGQHGVDLALTPAGNVTWLALASGRGLRWQQAESAGMAATAIGATVLNELDGASALTVEMVMGPVSSSPNNGARIFHAGADPNGELALSMTDNHAPELRIAGISVATWNSNLAAGRFVWHAVVDLADPIDPLRFHRDGVLQATTLLAVPPAQLSLASDQPFVIGNRITADRAPSGDIFYFAIYDRVLTAAEIAANVARLAATDDALDRN
jgi:hypothetical protein